MYPLRTGLPLAMLSLLGAVSAAACGGSAASSLEPAGPDASVEPRDASNRGEQDGSLGPEDAGVMDASDERGSLDTEVDAEVDASDAEVDAGDAVPPDPCDQMCDAEFRNVVDCHGDIVSACSASQGCSSVTRTCVDACQAAIDNKSSFGCSYYAVHMEQATRTCLAAVVANNGTEPLHIAVEYAGASLDVASFAAIPSGSGEDLVYGAYDAAAGLPPGEVAILFLVGKEETTSQCPKAAAVSESSFRGTNVGDAFHITTSLPAVAYQIAPYGGGTKGQGAGTLLLPTSVWGTNYLAVTAAPNDDQYGPSMNIVAMADETTVRMLPVAAVTGGDAIPASPAGEPFSFTLDKGQHAQFTQTADLTGSVILADKPIGFLAGQPCMRVPSGTSYCDHAAQMIPPIRALGSKYVGIMYRSRVESETSSYWRLIGIRPDTQLTWSSDVGGPSTLQQGESVIFQTGTPFVVQSQDAEHPFMLFQYMSSSGALSDSSGYGDPDFVISVPPEQYLSSYVFFTDPTYPETNLVMVRSRGEDAEFHDVTLDCLGVVPDWTPVGDDYEWARVDLSRNDFERVGECDNGVHKVSSDAPFGLWVWGWGSPNTTISTLNTSYGYPAGMNLQTLNQVVILPEP